jgi:antitoxin CptB
MSGMSRSSDGLSERRRRLLFRSWHRGIREMDLIMGRFADSCIESMNEAELDAYERLIEMPDPVLYGWIGDFDPVPPDFDTDLFRRLKAFHRGGPRA